MLTGTHASPGTGTYRHRFLPAGSRGQCSHNLRSRIKVHSAPASIGCKLIGVGSSAPHTVLTNNDLAKLVDTNDEWIVTRTGIQQRHVLAEGETLSQHAATASQNALKMAGINADQIDLILMATSSPDDAFGNACSVSGLCGCDARACCNASVVTLVSAALLACMP